MKRPLFYRIILSWQFALFLVLWCGWGGIAGFNYFHIDEMMVMSVWSLIFALLNVLMCGFWLSRLVYWRLDKDREEMIDDFLENWSPNMIKMMRSGKWEEAVKRANSSSKVEVLDK